MHEQLARRFREDKVVLEELVDRKERLLVERVDGVLLEDLLQEHLAQRRRQLVDEAADAEILVADDVLLRVEDLADLDGHLRFLVGLGKVAQMRRHRADAHDHGALAVHAQRLLDKRGGLFKVAHLNIVAKLLHEHHIVLAHGEDKAGLAVGENVLDGLDRNGLALFIRAADNEHAAVELGLHVQLLGAHIDIAQQDIVGEDALDKRGLVVLFLVIALGGVERDGRHAADGGAERVLAAGEGGKVKLSAPALERLEGLALKRDAVALGSIDGLHQMRPALSDLRQVGAGDDRPLRVDHANDRIGRFFKLQHDVLKDPTGHVRASLRKWKFVHFVNWMETLYWFYFVFARSFFFFSQKNLLFLDIS